jgi:hypothetical protein
MSKPRKFVLVRLAVGGLCIASASVLANRDEGSFVDFGPSHTVDRLKQRFAEWRDQLRAAEQEAVARTQTDNSQSAATANRSDWAELFGTAR